MSVGPHTSMAEVLMPQVVVTSDGLMDAALAMIAIKVAISIFLNQPSIFW